MRPNVRKPWVLPIAVLAATLGTRGEVHAGGTVDTPPKDLSVTAPIDSQPTHLFVSGAVHAVRFASSSSMSAKDIGCSVTATEGVPGFQERSLTVFCQANRRMSGTPSTFACAKVGDPGATDPLTGLPDPAGAEIMAMAAMVESITTDSFITFEFVNCPAPGTDPATGLPCGECLSLAVSNGSTHWQVPHD